MLKLNDICVQIAGTTVLRGVTCELLPGRIYAVVGRNGAGKTTLLRTIMGFAHAHQGEVFLAEKNVTRDPSHSRAGLGVGYAPEDRALFPTLSVTDNLRLPCESIGWKRSEVDKRLGDVLRILPQIEDLLPRSGAKLSGGQGKMAALARALMTANKLLLVDEPFQGLAPALARQFAEALSRVFEHRPQLCVVITESNVSLLDRVRCTHLALERGELNVESAATAMVRAERSAL